ncbi:FecR family protein [Chitinophaga tropicalis]|uniref:DUF4974 domain-containing protein n=1 Tax=Chitinophaga tropicalis TaxID=2683588 RepID=A0A7K1U0J8_9BACT|nr:FecR family protein [Chitinophaga tropicalis]MVT07891.1 DUF4974 domain-containing protein [Chitinophaga tropicalis]
MQKNSFQELLDKYLTGRMTEAEWELFRSMLNQPEYREQLEALIDTELEEHTFEGEQDNSILASIQERLQDNIKKRPGTIFSFIKKMAVACTLMVAIAGTAYWWFSLKPVPEKEVTVSSNTAITPGGNKAILQLGNGAKIILDNAKEGTLAQQGQAKIVKQGNGQLSYNVTGNTPDATVYNTISTPRGGQYQLTLSDGTKVWLNASSSLRYPAAFSGKERHVQLTGEGYFEVAKNASMPFHVQAGNVDVEVLGTHFNINSYTDEPSIRTTLLEGSVKVTDGRQASMLKPGQEASVKPEGGIKVQSDVDTEEVIAWKNGIFQFKAADIETVLRQAARWYDIQFEYKGGISARFSGQISRSANAEQLLKILELTGKVQFEIHGKNIVVKQ